MEHLARNKISRAFTGDFKDVGPKKIPLSGGIEVSVDCDITELQVVNPNGVDAIVWVRDLQATPIYLIPPTVVSANGGMVSFNARLGRLMRGGVEWSSSVDEKLHGYFNYRPHNDPNS